MTFINWDAYAIVGIGSVTPVDRFVAVADSKGELSGTVEVEAVYGHLARIGDGGRKSFSTKNDTEEAEEEGRQGKTKTVSAPRFLDRGTAKSGIECGEDQWARSQSPRLQYVVGWRGCARRDGVWRHR